MDPGVERFFDEWLGPQEQDPSRQCGDVLVRDRLGNWTYQFAVTVDDHLQKITDVIRGVDLLASTGRHPLVMKSPTQKLSKSDGDTGVRDLRTQGWTAAQVLEKAGSLLIP
jgi:glutamyl/glutaminyl-tRNA synthetase